MTDPETRIKRAVKFQNPVAKEVVSDKFRMRRVEDKKKVHRRLNRSELMKHYYERSDDDEDFSTDDGN